MSGPLPYITRQAAIDDIKRQGGDPNSEYWRSLYAGSALAGDQPDPGLAGGLKAFAQGVGHGVVNTLGGAADFVTLAPLRSLGATTLQPKFPEPTPEMQEHPVWGGLGQFGGAILPMMIPGAQEAGIGMLSKIPGVGRVAKLGGALADLGKATELGVAGDAWAAARTAEGFEGLSAVGRFQKAAEAAKSLTGALGNVEAPGGILAGFQPTAVAARALHGGLNFAAFEALQPNSPGEGMGERFARTPGAFARGAGASMLGAAGGMQPGARFVRNLAGQEAAFGASPLLPELADKIPAWAQAAVMAGAFSAERRPKVDPEGFRSKATGKLVDTAPEDLGIRSNLTASRGASDLAIRNTQLPGPTPVERGTVLDFAGKFLDSALEHNPTPENHALFHDLVLDQINKRRAMSNQQTLTHQDVMDLWGRKVGEAAHLENEWRAKKDLLEADEYVKYMAKSRKEYEQRREEQAVARHAQALEAQMEAEHTNALVDLLRGERGKEQAKIDAERRAAAEARDAAERALPTHRTEFPRRRGQNRIERTGPTGEREVNVSPSAIPAALRDDYETPVPAGGRYHSARGTVQGAEPVDARSSMDLLNAARDTSAFEATGRLGQMEDALRRARGERPTPAPEPPPEPLPAPLASEPPQPGVEAPPASSVEGAATPVAPEAAVAPEPVLARPEPMSASEPVPVKEPGVGTRPEHLSFGPPEERPRGRQVRAILQTGEDGATYDTGFKVEERKGKLVVSKDGKGYDIPSHGDAALDAHRVNEAIWKWDELKGRRKALAPPEMDTKIVLNPAKPAEPAAPEPPAPKPVQAEPAPKVKVKSIDAEALIDDLAINPDAKKSHAIALAKKLLASGHIDEGDFNEIQRISKDRDMTVDDLVSELQTSISLRKEAPPEPVGRVLHESEIAKIKSDAAENHLDQYGTEVSPDQPRESYVRARQLEELSSRMEDLSVSEHPDAHTMLARLEDPQSIEHRELMRSSKIAAEKAHAEYTRTLESDLAAARAEGSKPLPKLTTKQEIPAKNAPAGRTSFREVHDAVRKTGADPETARAAGLTAGRMEIEDDLSLGTGGRTKAKSSAKIAQDKQALKEGKGSVRKRC